MYHMAPVKELIPYLIRRAEENTSPISGQVNRELSRHLKEKKTKNKKILTILFFQYNLFSN